MLDNRFAHKVPKYVIIDCRYKYEYDGGHIRDAVHVMDPMKLVDEFLKNPPACPEQAPVLIFHCEFSSKRGPKM